MPNIQMPNGDVVAFPDEMPPDQIKTLISQKFPDIIKQKQKVDTFDTVSDNALQGATFGLGNRAAAGLAAGALSLADKRPFMDTVGENYKKAREVGTSRLEAEMQQSPATAIASNLAGGLATGGLGAETKAGTAIANSLRTGNLTSRIAKGALAGAASGAAYGGGTASYGKTGEGASSGAISGGLVGGAIPGIGAAVNDVYKTGKNAIHGIVANSPEDVGVAAEKLKGAGGQLYDQMRNIGATFKSSATKGFLLPEIDSKLTKLNFISGLTPKTAAIVDDLKQKVSSGDLGLDQLDQFRRQLGRTGGGEESVASGAVRRVIDDFVDNANGSHLSNGTTKAISLLHQGRQQYKQASKYEEISGILTRSDGDANKIKSGLKRFLNNEDNLRGWSASEKSQLKDAANSSGTEQLLKLGGKFGIDLGSSLNVGNAIGPIVGYGVGGGITPIAGTAARQTQKLAARGKAQNLLNVLDGSASPTIARAPTSGLLSAPAGGIAGEMRGNETRQPMRMTITPQDKLPMPTVNLPQISPQSSVQPQLFDRVIQAESRGNQSALSNKGAIGVAQIMPRTAPDAARAAGLPYDFNKLKSDPEYNAALGKAYLGKMLDRYKGNEAHALIAYNWGPGNTDKWLRSGANISRLPKETRDYIQKILGA